MFNIVTPNNLEHKSLAMSYFLRLVTKSISRSTHYQLPKNVTKLVLALIILEHSSILGAYPIWFCCLIISLQVWISFSHIYVYIYTYIFCIFMLLLSSFCIKIMIFKAKWVTLNLFLCFEIINIVYETSVPWRSEENNNKNTFPSVFPGLLLLEQSRGLAYDILLTIQ
jgi:hypothetical protein